MTGLEFIAGIIDNIFSWPVAVLLIVLILRKQLAELFHTVESFVVEAGGTRVSFNRTLERAKEGLAEAKRALPPTKRADLDEAESQDDDHYFDSQSLYALDYSQEDPEYAVVAAWERLIVEQVRRLAHVMGLSPSGTPELLRELKSLGVINDDIWNSVKYLNDLHVFASRGKITPTPSQAIEYIQVARDMARYLNSLRKEATKKSPPQ
jgi:hypothetical protein